MTVIEQSGIDGTINRVLFSQVNNLNGLTIICFAGIHGNERAGIKGLKNLTRKISSKNIKLRCNFYALAGNLNALKKNVRFDERDLNRIWTRENIERIKSQTEHVSPEDRELFELFNCIEEIIDAHTGPFIFIDLHTTSSETNPFITISDSLNNRKFVSRFNIPIILGIEEHIEGPLLTYINEFGHIAIGFEAGQHLSLQSIENCEAFIWIVLEASNCVSKDQIEHWDYYNKILPKKKLKRSFYEIKHHHKLHDRERFRMKNGFKNFDGIKKNEVLAFSDDREIKAGIKGKIFMPLYQLQGEDGFFIVTKISIFWLNLSSIFRKLKLYHLLYILPGIDRDKSHPYVLLVNPKIAKFLTNQIFHLFGYRKKIVFNNKLHFIRRDRKIKPLG